jgi:hypothetical protein
MWMSHEILTSAEITAILAGLSLLAVGLYYLIPDVCWITEKNLAWALGTHNRAISAAKRELEKAGLVRIVHEQNKPNRLNPIHRIFKVPSSDLHPIPDVYLYLNDVRERILSPYHTEVEDGDVKNPVKEATPSVENFGAVLKWNLLTKFSAAELNRLAKLEQVELLQEVGLLVLPTNYPKFSPTGEVSCSCGKADCRAIGKHPKVQGYKGITPDTYSKRRSYFLKRFKNDPDLNLGLKPLGFSVLDVDYPHGGGYSLGLLREEIPGLDETLSVKSPNGEHLYTSSAGFNQSASTLGKGLDIRSDKTTGFIVAPGSVHRSGSLYLWSSVNELQPIPDDWLSFNSPISGNRGSLAGRKTGKTLEAVRIPNQIPLGYAIPVGQRGTTLFKFACRERGRGASEGHIYDVLVTLRDTYCERSVNLKDDISDAELRSIAKSAASYPTNAEKMQH